MPNAPDRGRATRGPLASTRNCRDATHPAPTLNWRLDFPSRNSNDSIGTPIKGMVPMSVSSKCYYALRAVYALADHMGPEPLKIADIAEKEQIPIRFLEVIL